MRKRNVIGLVLIAVLVALSLNSGVKADESNKKTVVTFNQDVEIPGWVLPAGTYVFKLLNSSANRFTVQVWDQDEMHLITMLQTIGDSYPNPDGNPYFVLDTSQTDEGYPPAIVSWFFAGSNEGRDFIYPGSSNTRMVDNQESSQPQVDSQETPQAQPEQ
jgi:hypothetical protein